MFMLAHHPPDIHVHLVIDLRREIAIVHCVSTVAQAPMLCVRLISCLLHYGNILLFIATRSLSHERLDADQRSYHAGSEENLDYDVTLSPTLL